MKTYLIIGTTLATLISSAFSQDSTDISDSLNIDYSWMKSAMSMPIDKGYSTGDSVMVGLYPNERTYVKHIIKNNKGVSKTLYKGYVEADKATKVLFDGLDDNGKLMPSGVYFESCNDRTRKITINTNKK